MKYLNVVLALFSLLAATPTLAQESEREGVAFRSEPSDELRLREWLHYRADGSSRTLPIVGGFAFGAAMGGLGIYGLVDDGPVGGSLGRIYLSVGVLSLAAPIVLLATQNHPQLDLENLPERSLSEREIGYYEGILQSEARIGRALRVGRGIQGGLQAIAGGVGFALTLNDGGFGESPIESGLYLGLGIGGLLSALSSFFKTRSERIWDAYSAGVVPGAEFARVRFLGDSVQLSF